MFGSSLKEDLIGRFLEDRPIFGGGGDEVEEFRRELDRMSEDGRDLSEVRVEDVKARLAEKE